VGKAEVTLVDTSSWIEFLRGSGTPAADRVADLIRADQAAWCELIALELWNGVRPGAETRALEDLEQAVTLFEISGAVWNTARKLAAQSRQLGFGAPSADVLIAACATTHNLALEHCDKHLTKLCDIAQTL